MQSILQNVSIKNLFDVGAHLGHKKKFWHPGMLPYIYGTSNANTHIIDLQKTVNLLKRALKKITEVVSNSGRVLFVGTKMQASDTIKEEAIRCGQFYVNLRWPSGMLTNWHTVSKSIKKLVNYERTLEKESESLNKKEILTINRNKDKIEKYLGGVRKMGGLPNVIFVVDPYKEHIAIEEAKKLGIPVVAIVDTNCNPSGIAYPIPANDDSTKAIKYYCTLIADAVLAGIEYEVQKKGKVRRQSSNSEEAEKTAMRRPDDDNKSRNKARYVRQRRSNDRVDDQKEDKKNE